MLSTMPSHYDFFADAVVLQATALWRGAFRCSTAYVDPKSDWHFRNTNSGA